MRMGSKMGKNLLGMRDDVADPLQNESMTAAGPKGSSQVAKATPDMQINPSTWTANPTRGTGPATQKVANTTGTTQEHNSARPNHRSGKNDAASKGSRVGRKSRLRRAFGVEMPMQSGNSKGTSEGSRAAQQTSFVTQRGHNLNKFHATPSNTSKPATKAY